MVTPRSVMRPRSALSAPACKSIDAFEWLVEEKNPRPVNHRRGQCKFFLHAVRVVGDQGFWAVGELHKIKQLFGTTLRCGTVQAVHAADELKILGASQSFEEAHTFGDNADLPFHFDRMRCEVQPEKLGARPELWGPAAR